MEKVIAVDAVIEKDGKVLLIRRASSTFFGKLALPGGRVENSERVEEAVVREVKEETGLDVVPQAILGVYSGSDIDPRGWAAITVFVCKTIGGRERAASDASELVWVRPEEVDAVQMGFKHHPKILKDYANWKKKGGTFWMTRGFA